MDQPTRKLMTIYIDRLDVPRKDSEDESIRVIEYKNKINTNYSTDNVRGSLNKFPGFFRMSTFIDSTHMKL